MFEDIEYEVAEGVATIRLARPDVRNALRIQTLSEIQEALIRSDDDEDVYAVVVTGEGTAFCAGADLSLVPAWRDSDYETYEAELGEFQATIERLRSMGTPSIAAVNGPGVGAGCDLALACDVRVVEPNASFVEGFVHVGLISGDGGRWLLPRLIGEAKAKKYLLTGKPIDAETAVDVGLAIELAADAETSAHEFALELRALPASAVRRTKELATMRPESLAGHMERATEAQWDCLQDDEHAAVMNARLEGRNPDLDRP